MTIDGIVQIVSKGLYIIILLSAPTLIISLVVGLIVSIFQAVTSIQEQTLTFVPKIIGVFLGLAITGYWMLSTLKDYMIELWTDFSVYIH
jgi:flagellar biosynthesis protein FliQ